MTPRVKQIIKKYLSDVNIKNVRKSKRIPLIKECIFKLNYLEKNGLLDKIKVMYPMLQPNPSVPFIIEK
jgi:hypothetical protein